MTIYTNSEYNIEAAIIFNLVNFPTYRKEIFDLCQDIDFGVAARPVFQQLLKAYNDNLIDTQSFKTQFLSNWCEQLKEGKGKCWPEVKNDFFDRAMRRKGHWESQLLGTLFDDPKTPISDIQDRVKQLNEIVNDVRVYKQPIYSLKHVISDTIDQMQKILNDEFKVIPWGISALDFHCQIEAGDLLVVGARPGVGKTLLSLNALLGATNDQPCAYYSAEMNSEVLGKRFLSMLTQIDHGLIRNPKKLKEKNLLNTVFEVIKEASKRNIYINTTVGLTVEQISEWIKQIVEYKGVKHVFIDYLQRLRPSNSRIPRPQQVQHISMTLKNLASELGIAITALCQLNRESVGNRPQISNLSESAFLEQDASTILLLDRVDDGSPLGNRNYKYRFPGTERLETCTMQQLKDTMIIIIAKSRHDKQKILYFDCDYSTFTIHGEKKFTGDFAKYDQNINKRQKGK